MVTASILLSPEGVSLGKYQFGELPRLGDTIVLGDQEFAVDQVQHQGTPAHCEAGPEDLFTWLVVTEIGETNAVTVPGRPAYLSARPL